MFTMSGPTTVNSFIGMEEDTSQLWLLAWRYVNCGRVTDPGVIRNRPNALIEDDRYHSRGLGSSSKLLRVRLIP